MQAVTALAPGGGLRAASCAALGLSRASLHRRQSARQRPPAARPPRPSPQRALGVAERRSVLDLMREARFVDLAPAEIYATLLDEGVYRCCIRTMYRVLAAHGEVRERRDQLRHPVYTKPELLAEGPNQIWSWDITKLMPAKWSYFYLYVILDIFSRRVVGWQVADAGDRRLVQANVRRGRRQPRHRAGPAHPPRRSRRADAGEGHRPAARRSRRDKIT